MIYNVEMKYSKFVNILVKRLLRSHFATYILISNQAVPICRKTVYEGNS